MMRTRMRRRKSMMIEHNNINIDDGGLMRMVSMHHGRGLGLGFKKRKEMLENRKQRNTFELI